MSMRAHPDVIKWSGIHKREKERLKAEIARLRSLNEAAEKVIEQFKERIGHYDFEVDGTDRLIKVSELRELIDAYESLKNKT